MLSKRSQYAFRALTVLAEQYEQGPVLIATIARKKKIPLKFLENILLELKEAKILESKKGKGGGYFLKNLPEKTTLASIIRIVNGPIALLPCVSLYFYESCKGCDKKSCQLSSIMEEVRDATLGVLEHRTLKDLTATKKKSTK